MTLSPCIKSTLYTLNTHPRGPIFTPFRSMPSRFWDIRSSKTENAPTGPEWHIVRNRQKFPVYTEYSPRGPNFTPFRSTNSRFIDTKMSKIEMHPMIQNDLNHLSVKISYIHWIPTHPRPIFHSVALYDQPFWGESSLPVAHPGYQVLSDIMFRLGLIANALT